MLFIVLAFFLGCRQTGKTSLIHHVFKGCPHYSLLDSYIFLALSQNAKFQKRRSLELGSPESGEAFETYIAHELKSYCDYFRKGELAYWRSTSGFEVDFILNDEIAIEVKAKPIVSHQDLKGLRALQEELKLSRYIVVSFELEYRVVDGIEIYPWKLFLQEVLAE